jgi:cytochrome P450
MDTQDDVVRLAEVLWSGENPYNKGEHMALGFPALWISRRFSGPKNTIYRAVQVSLARMWGTDTDGWRVVNPTDTVFRTVKQAVYASYLGYKNSYVPEMWETGQTMADGVFYADYGARCVPKFLRWQALWVTGWYVRRLHARFRGWLCPLVARRVETLTRSTKAGLGDDSKAEPTLLDTLVLDEMDKQNKPGQLLPRIAQERIVRLITGLIFSATQTTSIAGSRTIDLLIRTASEKVRQHIREEVEAEEASLKTGGAITKSSLNHLTTLDSALRESMRLYPVESTTPVRTLLVDHHFDLNGTQYFLKTGTRISFASINVMNDPDIFENPEEYDPPRFAREGHEDGRNAYSALGYEYLAWGHGKTACPGRQLASDILKLTLAEMFLRYDMKPEKEGGRMENTRIGPFLPADRSRNFLVRRRKE